MNWLGFGFRGSILDSNNVPEEPCVAEPLLSELLFSATVHVSLNLYHHERELPRKSKLLGGVLDT